MLKKILPLALWLTATISALGQNAVMVNRSNSIITYPLDFWTANALVGRSGLGFNTNLNAFWTATNAATARTAIGALATNGNGSALTNLTASNVTGTLAISNGGSGATTADGARTNLSLGWLALTNPQSSLYSGTATTLLGYVPEISPSSSNLTGYNVLAYTNTNSLVIPANLLIAEDAVPAARNPRYVQINGAATISYPYVSESTIFGANYASVTDQLTFTNSIATWNSNAVTMDMPIAFSTNTAAATTRTNLSLGWPALTNSNAANVLLGYTTNFGGVVMPSSLTFGSNVTFSQSIFATTNGVSAGGTLFAGSGSTISFYAAEDQSRWRTNLGLGWSALTNTNPAGFNTSLYGSGTNPVLYNTNGDVVSPTNFWQVAPIVTRFVESQPTTNQTTNIAAARSLHIHSLNSPWVPNVTNIIALPTTGSFNGDVALVVHQGPTNTLTAVRTAGAATNLITLNQFKEAVEFVYYNNVWQFNHNQSFTEPIFFSGTNAAANAAASRTNLGLGQTNSVTFSALTLSSDLTLGSGDNIVLSTTNGTKIGTATNQLLGFYNQTPIARPSSTGVTTNGFTQESGNNVHTASTFTGGIGTNAYTISDIVAHLKSLGLIAP